VPAQLTDVLACCAISFKLLSSACMLWQVTTVMLSSTAFISCVTPQQQQQHNMWACLGTRSHKMAAVSKCDPASSLL
jgi:hypothetical protein